jgi:hypothetical protein
MNNEAQGVLGDDIISGVPKIAKYLRETEDETRWHIRRGHYDAAIFRVGKLIKARKSLLNKLLSPQGMNTALLILAIIVSEVAFVGIVWVHPARGEADDHRCDDGAGPGNKIEQNKPISFPDKSSHPNVHAPALAAASGGLATRKFLMSDAVVPYCGMRELRSEVIEQVLASDSSIPTNSMEAACHHAGETESTGSEQRDSRPKEDGGRVSRNG